MVTPHPRRLLALLALVLVLGASAGCGERDEAATTRTTASTVPTTTAVRVYFLRGETVAPAHRAVTPTRTPLSVALTALLAGPTADETSFGLTSAIPASTSLRGVTIRDHTAIVDLSGRFESGGGSLSMSARLAQVVYTATQFPTVHDVRFRLDGRDATVFGGEGLILDHALARADYDELTAAIFVDTPAFGATVSSPVRIAGTANVFEATFRVLVTDRAGVIVADEAVHATSGTGTRGTFDVRVDARAARTGPGSVTAFQDSPKGDGSRLYLVEIPVTISASS